VFGLGKKKADVDVRSMLASAAEDFGGAKLRERALFFYDNREAFETRADHTAGEPPWVADGYEPVEAEVAAEVLRETLLEDRRAVVIDWAAGATRVLDEFDNLFERAGRPRIDPQRREALTAACEETKRGDAVLKLMDPMDAEAEARGLLVHWWAEDQSDVHVPQLLTADAMRKWRNVSFGKKFPVLP